MKKLCLWTLVVVIIVVGLGFFRGWFTLTSDREDESKNIDVKLSVDTDKVKQDAASVTGGSKTKDLSHEQ